MRRWQRRWGGRRGPRTPTRVERLVAERCLVPVCPVHIALVQDPVVSRALCRTTRDDEWFHKGTHVNTNSSLFFDCGFVHGYKRNAQVVGLLRKRLKVVPAQALVQERRSGHRRRVASVFGIVANRGHWRRWRMGWWGWGRQWWIWWHWRWRRRWRMRSPHTPTRVERVVAERCLVLVCPVYVSLLHDCSVSGTRSDMNTESLFFCDCGVVHGDKRNVPVLGFLHKRLEVVPAYALVHEKRSGDRRRVANVSFVLANGGHRRRWRMRWWEGWRIWRIWRWRRRWVIRRAALGHTTSKLDLKVRGVRGFASAVPKQGCAFWAWARFASGNAASSRRRAALESLRTDTVARVLELWGFARGGAARKIQRDI